MATPDKEKLNPVDEYIKQANDYTQQANDYRTQGANIDSQLQSQPDFDYNKFYDEWKTGKKPVVDILSSYYKKPEQEINQEQEQKAKFGAALTDSLSSLAEMAASGKGAYVRNRGNEPTSTQTTNARLQAIKDKYDQNLLNYNSATGNAALQDFQQQLESAMNAKGQKRQYLLYNAKELKDNAKQANKDAFSAKKDAADYQLKLEDQGLKGKELEQKMKEFKAKQQVDWYEAKTGRLNSQKYTGSLTGATPEDYIQVNEKAETLPKDWIVQKGYMHVIPGKDRRTPPTYRWDSKATPAIKKALIDMYNQEQNTNIPEEQPKPTPNWKLPLMQEGNKVTKGKTISNF